MAISQPATFWKSVCQLGGPSSKCPTLCVCSFNPWYLGAHFPPFDHFLRTIDIPVAMRWQSVPREIFAENRSGVIKENVNYGWGGNPGSGPSTGCQNRQQLPVGEQVLSARVRNLHCGEQSAVRCEEGMQRTQKIGYTYQVLRVC